MSTTRATSALLALSALTACPVPTPQLGPDSAVATDASAAVADASSPRLPGPPARAALDLRHEVATADGQAAIDRRAVSGLELSRCVDAGICGRPSYDAFNRQPDYRDEPAMSVDWYMARSYCDFVGKRLPTLREYEQTWQQLTWLGCCARNVVPREWVAGEPGGPRATQVRLQQGRLQVLEVSKRMAVDSTTVRCARDLDPR